MIPFSTKYALKYIILVCLVIFFSHLDVLYINIMEARNFVTAREMLTEGHWLLTTMNGLPRYEKPPLPTWLTALSALIFGMKSLFALRLPAALAATFLVWMLYRFSKQIKNDNTLGLLASLILATSFYIIFAGRNGQWDIFTHSFMLAGIYFFFRFLEDAHKLWSHILLAAFFTACSFLSKGPVSLYALFLPFLIAYGLTYRFKALSRKIIPLAIFIVVALGIGLSWYLYVRWADTAAFMAIAEEEVTNWNSYNIRPFYYYWSFFTQSGIWTIPAFIGLLYPYLKNRVQDKRAYQFSFLWTVLSVILLSVIPEKKSRYLLPVLIPMALNTAFYMEYLIREFKNLKDKKETYPVYMHFGLIGILGISFPIAGYLFFGEKLKGLYLYFGLLSVALVGIGGLMLIQLYKKNIYPVFLLSIGFVMSIMMLGFPISKAFNTNRAFQNIDHFNSDIQKKDLTLYVFSEIAPEMVWHYGRAIPLIKQQGKMVIPPEKTFGVLVVPHQVNAFKDAFRDHFRLQQEKIFNINYQETNKNRLISTFYIVTRSDESN